MNKIGWIILMLFVTVFVCSAKVYKWVDENGVTHYSAKDPKNGAQEIKVKGMEEEGTDQASNSGGPDTVLDCEKVVKHGIQLMKKKYAREYNNQPNSFLATLDDPSFIADGVKECNREKKDPRKAAQWLCQQNAKTFDEVQACED